MNHESKKKTFSVTFPNCTQRTFVAEWALFLFIILKGSLMTKQQEKKNTNPKKNIARPIAYTLVTLFALAAFVLSYISFIDIHQRHQAATQGLATELSTLSQHIIGFKQEMRTLQQTVMAEHSHIAHLENRIKALAKKRHLAAEKKRTNTVGFKKIARRFFQLNALKQTIGALKNAPTLTTKTQPITVNTSAPKQATLWQTVWQQIKPFIIIKKHTLQAKTLLSLNAWRTMKMMAQQDISFAQWGLINHQENIFRFGLLQAKKLLIMHAPSTPGADLICHSIDTMLRKKMPVQVDKMPMKKSDLPIVLSHTPPQKIKQTMHTHKAHKPVTKVPVPTVAQPSLEA